MTYKVSSGTLSLCSLTHPVAYLIRFMRFRDPVKSFRLLLSERVQERMMFCTYLDLCNLHIFIELENGHYAIGVFTSWPKLM